MNSLSEDRVRMLATIPDTYWAPWPNADEVRALACEVLRLRALALAMQTPLEEAPCPVSTSPP